MGKKSSAARMVWLDRPQYKRLAAFTFWMEKHHLFNHTELIYSQVIGRLMDKVGIPKDPEEIKNMKNPL